MPDSALDRMRLHHARLMVLASSARSRGQSDFADLLAARAAEYLIQIGDLEDGPSAGQTAEPA